MEHLTLANDRVPLRQIERLIRNQVGRAGQIWVFANTANFRRLRRLAARFRCDPVPGGDIHFNGPPPLPPHEPGRPGETIADAGGLLIISARPFPTV